MQVNQNNSLEFLTVGIEELASNPRNGHILIEASVRLLETSDFSEYRETLDRLFNGFIQSEMITEELDYIERSNTFFAYTKLYAFFLNLENAFNVIMPPGKKLIDIQEPNKYIKLEK
ncbi:MAG: hypothetical protein Q8K70_01795 [Bacteroidota bacterium]|nr:hypothetical protein [Bacteroidota bacterium]